MPREAEPSLNEKEFILGALQENTRLDGRSLDDYREVKISFGDEYGMADVQLGKTRYALSQSRIYCYADHILQGSSHASLRR